MIASNTEWHPVFIRLARAMFGAYNAHSGGKAWDGKDVPCWTEIVEREHDKADTPSDRRDDVRPEGVAAHWRAVAHSAAQAASRVPGVTGSVIEVAESMAGAYERAYERDPVFMRIVQ